MAGSGVTDEAGELSLSDGPESGELVEALQETVEKSDLQIENIGGVIFGTDWNGVFAETDNSYAPFVGDFDRAADRIEELLDYEFVDFYIITGNPGRNAQRFIEDLLEIENGSWIGAGGAEYQEDGEIKATLDLDPDNLGELHGAVLETAAESVDRDEDGRVVVHQPADNKARRTFRYEFPDENEAEADIDVEEFYDSLVEEVGGGRASSNGEEIHIRLDDEVAEAFGEMNVRSHDLFYPSWAVRWSDREGYDLALYPEEGDPGYSKEHAWELLDHVEEKAQGWDIESKNGHQGADFTRGEEDVTKFDPVPGMIDNEVVLYAGDSEADAKLKERADEEGYPVLFFARDEALEYCEQNPDLEKGKDYFEFEHGLEYADTVSRLVEYMEEDLTD